MKTISVVIPTKDRPQFLSSALTSFKNFINDIEIIVIDDGSTIDNARLNEQVCKSINKCHYQCLNKGRGAARARNFGLSQSQGQWIWFVDDDDIVPVKTIKDVLKVIKQKEHVIKAILLPMNHRIGTVAINQITPSPERNTFESYRHRGHEVNTSCALFLRKLLIDIRGWDNSLLAGQDTDLFLRISQTSSYMCVQTDPVIVNIGHSKRTTRHIFKQQLGKLQFLKKHWSILTIRRRLYYISTFVFCIPCFYGLKMKIRVFSKKAIAKTKS